MELNNILATDKDQHLRFLGDHLLSYAVDRRAPEPLGYPSGRLCPGDFFAVVFPNQSFLYPGDREIVEQLTGQPLPTSATSILVGSTDNSDILPLLKTVDQMTPEEPILLHTIYCGHKIHIEFLDKTCNQLLLQIDGQNVRSLASDVIPMVIFDSDGIKYFRTEHPKTRTISVGEVLSGVDFDSFWDAERMLAEKVTVEQVLRSDLVQVLNSGNSSGCQFVPGKSSLQVEPIILPDFDRGMDLWSITPVEDLLEKIRSDCKVYQQMTRPCGTATVTGEISFGLWGEDEKISKIRYLLQKSAITNTTILLTGESGTGKTFLAREIHQHSKRSDRPFVHVNCAAIPYNLIESELFGYDDGAFTGARKGGRAGYFEMADQGTLFLDEITEMPLALQGKLLEVMQNKTYFRIGGDKKRVADVRIIAATNRDLQELVAKRGFREDLYYRIHVFPIHIPPLRERMDSLFGIVTDLLPEICNRLDVSQQVLSIDALEKMKRYDWPGNIRELENALEKACILSDGKMIRPEDIDIEPRCDTEDQPSGNCTLKQLREEFEKSVIEKTLRQFNGSKVKTARQLGIGKTSLFEKINKYKIEDTEEPECY